jgi:hypothetical protein
VPGASAAFDRRPMPRPRLTVVFILQSLNNRRCFVNIPAGRRKPGRPVIACPNGPWRTSRRSARMARTEIRGQLDRLPGFGLVARCRSPARQEQKPVGAALLKTRHQNLPLRDRTLEFHVRGQFPHAETRSLWTKRRPIAAFRARPDSVCVRHGLAGWGGGIRTSASWIATRPRFPARA